MPGVWLDSLSLKNRITVLTLGLFMLGIWSVTFYATRDLRQDMVALLGAQQYSTVSAVAKQINGELESKRLNLEALAAELAPRLADKPATLKLTLEDHRRHLGLFNGGLILAGPEGRVLVSVADSSDPAGGGQGVDEDTLAVALKQGRAYIGRPRAGQGGQGASLSMAVPIKAKGGRVVGALMGSIDLGQPTALDLMIESRYGQTGGFLVIAPQHGMVITATDKTRLMSPMPAPGLNAMHDRYVQGYEGYGIAVNSRGVEELSAAKRIPVTDWFLVGVLPTAEAFAPIRVLERRIQVSALILSVLAGLLAWWWVRRMLRQQFQPMLAATVALADMSRTHGRLPSPLPVARQDEIGELIKEFNRLLETSRERETLLRESEQHYRTVANGGSALIWTSGTDKLCNYFNEPWLRFTGRRLEQELGQGWAEGVHPDDLDRCMQVYGQAFDQRVAFSMVYRLQRHDGEYRWIRDDGNPRYDSQGRFLGYIGFCYDVSEDKLADEKLRRAASVFSHAREGIFVTDPEGRISDANEAFTRITGYTLEEAIGQKPSLLRSGLHGKEFYEALWHQLAETGHWAGEIWNKRKNGEIYAELLTISTVRDGQGNPLNYIALFADITTQKQHQKQLEHNAHYDVLTGLPNRLLLADRLRQGMTQAQRRGQLLGLAYIDLDGFKAINDTHGHDVGDEFLIKVSQRMKRTLREGDTLSRLGGDEFVVILVDLPERKVVEPLLTRLLAAAAEPVMIDQWVLKVSASIGVTFYPQAEEADADQLLRQADQAMYQVKLGGKNHYHYFDLEKDRSLRGYHQSLERIRQALHEGEFVLHYQPKVNMRSGELLGVEALIRWQHPEMGLLAPVAFLPVIEDHPLSVDVGEWVIAKALAQIGAWQDMGLSVPVSVNVGARQLQQKDFVLRLGLILEAHPGIHPGMLQLEVLETSALEDIEQVSAVIDACRSLGILFALDDFGTGYSSLTYLKRLPVRALKIDQSFVRDMLDDVDDLAILDGVLGLASAFAKESVAEGVETEAHGELLLRLGCDVGQGFGITHPMAADQLPAWIARWRPPDMWRKALPVTRESLPTLYAIIEHRSWVEQVVAYLHAERAAPPELDEKLCRFGAWLQGDRNQDRGRHDPAFAAMDALHRQIHGLARELVLQYASGKAEEAEARISDLLQLRDAVITCLNQHLLFVAESN